MAELRTAIAIGAAAATFAVGAVVASSMSTNGDAGAVRAADESTSTNIPGVGDYANEWHVQTAVASFESRLLRYAQRDDSFTGARFAFRSRSFILYGAGAPSPVVGRLLDDAPLGVAVTWVRVPYSRGELDRAIRRLRRAMPPRSVVEDAPNYGGILVGLHPVPTSPGRQAALYSRAQVATDVPVTFLQAAIADQM
jgi:hypothetical protein